MFKMEEKDQESLVKYILAKLSETPLLAKSNTQANGIPLRHRRTYIRIKKYVDDFIMGEKLGNIENRLIILPGLRGVGKTTMLFQIYEHIRNVKNVSQDRVLYFSTDELKAYLGKSILDVINVYIQNIHRTSLAALDKEIFILIDESHFDHEWSQTAKIIFDQSKKVFLIFTGSSALNLELSVDTARRTKKETVFPLNFSEYLTLKYDLFPSKGMAQNVRELIFKGDDESIESASANENQLMRKTLSLNKRMDMIWEDFLCYGGFPFGLNMSQIEVHQRIFSMVDRVIEKDVFALQSFNTDTRNDITRILTFLALQTPGGTSDAKLAERLKISPTLVRTILDILEKTHLIFSVKPHGGAGKVIRKPWKYYFLSPSINAAIRFKLGVYDIRNREMLGVLAENLVASYLFRMMETVNMPTGIFYDSEEGGVDFLIHNVKNSVIPIEVSIGDKNQEQVKAAIKRYGSDYGIIISNTEKIRKDGNIIYLPLTTFSFG